jgi:hypothetical protein
MSDGWSRNVSFNMLRYEEARKRDPRVDRGCCSRRICEDGPELPKEAAQEGGEVLERTYAAGCESLDQAATGSTVHGPVARFARLNQPV